MDRVPNAGLRLKKEEKRKPKVGHVKASPRPFVAEVDEQHLWRVADRSLKQGHSSSSSWMALF